VSDLHQVHLHTVRPQAWRNGGGVTRELLAWPQGAHWQLRVSVAEIDRSGNFSPFPGVTRCFAVVSGDGVRLDLPGGSVTLGPGDEPLTFDGEAAPHCHLLGGPTQDLNLMAVREAGAVRLQRARPGSSLDGPTRWRGLYAATPVLLQIDGVGEPLHAGTLAWSDAVESSSWELPHGGGGSAWWLTLDA